MRCNCTENHVKDRGQATSFIWFLGLNFLYQKMKSAEKQQKGSHNLRIRGKRIAVEYMFRKFSLYYSEK